MVMEASIMFPESHVTRLNIETVAIISCLFGSHPRESRDPELLWLLILQKKLIRIKFP